MQHRARNIKKMLAYRSVVFFLSTSESTSESCAATRLVVERAILQSQCGYRSIIPSQLQDK